MMPLRRPLVVPSDAGALSREERGGEGRAMTDSAGSVEITHFVREHRKGMTFGPRFLDFTAFRSG